MSYILDALERSEAERRRGEVPDLLVRPAEPLPPARRWPLVLGVVLALNLIGLGALWWLLRPSPAAPPGLAAPAPAQQPAGAVDGPQVAAPPAILDRAPVTPAPTPPLTPVAAVPTPPAARPAPAGAPPQVAVSSHVYSEYPDLRAVTIDGRRLQEGASIRPGLTLREITENGVVLEQDGALHRISLLDDWGL